jgi:hypothetical protein
MGNVPVTIQPWHAEFVVTNATVIRASFQNKGLSKVRAIVTYGGRREAVSGWLPIRWLTAVISL